MASQSSLSKAPFLPHLTPLMGKSDNFGIYKIDHAVGNVHNLLEAHNEIKKFTGFHEFAEFTSDDVGTVDSGLNSVVLASDSEDVLLPLNEPTKGLRKSQILTFLEQNEGPGLQHLALRTTDIFSTVRKMKKMQGSLFGFELMRQPSEEYYRELPERLGDQLTVRLSTNSGDLMFLKACEHTFFLLTIFFVVDGTVQRIRKTWYPR